MPKRKRREHGRSGFSSPRHANVPTQYQRAGRCGRRKLHSFMRSGQRGCGQVPFSRSAKRGTPPDYVSKDVNDFSEGLATTANSHSPERKCRQFRFQMTHDDFPSDERNNVLSDHHSRPHYGSTDVVDCSERQHDRATKRKTKWYGNCIKTVPKFSSKTALNKGFSSYEKTNFVIGNYSNPEWGTRDAFCSSEESLSYRDSSAPMKIDQYVNSTENEHCFGFEMDRYAFPFDERMSHAIDHQHHIICEQDGKNQIISLPAVRIKTQNAQLMQNSTDATDQDYLYWISYILSCLVKNGNRMELEQLQRQVEGEHATQYSNFEMEIEKFPNIFDISERIPDTEVDGNEEEGILRDKYVTGKTEMSLCEKHCSNPGSCSAEDCNGLHICKFYFLNTCSFKQCLFGHDIRDSHNIRVLQMHLLHALSPKDLGCLMRNIRNRNETTMPTICRFYNGRMGCSHNECQFLHLCRWFVMNDCKLGLKCQRSHNYFDQQPSLVLKRYGILEEKYMEDVKMFLRDAERKMENKSHFVSENAKEYSVGSISLNRIVKYDQGNPADRKGSPLCKSSVISNDEHIKRDGSKLEERVSAEIQNSMSDKIATGEICKEIEEARDSPNWIKPCLPISSCNGKLEVKSLTPLAKDTNEITTAGNQKVGKRSAVDLKHECLDQTDRSKHLERPCFSDRLSTTTANKLDSFNNSYAGTNFVQGMRTTVIENGFTVIPVDDELLGESEQRLSFTIVQKHVNSSVADDARNLEVKRVIGKDGMPTWIYRVIDTMTSLPLEPDTCDHLEKSYQQFQQTRKCSIEICGLKLDVDLLTVEEAPLILPVQTAHETP